MSLRTIRLLLITFFSLLEAEVWRHRIGSRGHLGNHSSDDGEHKAECATYASRHGLLGGLLSALPQHGNLRWQRSLPQRDQTSRWPVQIQ